MPTLPAEVSPSRAAPGPLLGLAGLLVAVAVWAAPRPALADEGESALSLSAGYQSFTVPKHAPPGGGLGLEYERGLGQAFSLRAAAGGGLFGDSGELSYGGQATLGLTYVVDIIKYVPYLTGGLGATVLGGGSVDTEVHPVVELGAGIDLLTRRSLSYGAWVRVASFLDDSALYGAGFRVTWRWGFF